MNEHPGVRPVVVQPQTGSVKKPVRALPRSARTMPQGFSANSLGLWDGRGTNWRRVALVGVPLAVVLALTLGAWLFARSLAPLAPASVANGAYEYNFLFYKSSERVNLVAGSGLQHGNTALVIAKSTSERELRDCHDMGRTWREAFRTRVVGATRPVCQLDGTVFAVTFGYGQAKHLFEINYTDAQAANSAEVRQIIESLRVSIP